MQDDKKQRTKMSMVMLRDIEDINIQIYQDICLLSKISDIHTKYLY
jgi:hypothetical protein